MQALVVAMQKQWNATAMMSPPSSGALASFDSGLLVTPPPGLQYGYVPIVTSQRLAPATRPPRPVRTLICVRDHHTRRVRSRAPHCPPGWRAT